MTPIGQVGVAVDGRGDPAVGDGEQRITKDVEVLQAAAVAAEGLPVDELDEVDRVVLDAERPVVVDQDAPATGQDLPLLVEREADRDRVPRRTGGAHELNGQEDQAKRDQDVGHHGQAPARERDQDGHRREPHPERTDEKCLRLRQVDTHDEEHSGKAGRAQQRGEEPEVARLQRARSRPGRPPRRNGPRCAGKPASSSTPSWPGSAPPPTPAPARRPLMKIR